MEKQMIAKAINKMTRFQLSTFLMLCCISSQVFALNLTEGPPIPKEFALAEKSDPYGRIASSYIVPDRWTNIVSPLNELKVRDGWALTDFETVKFIFESNIQEDDGANGLIKASREDCREILINNPRKYFKSGELRNKDGGIDYSKPTLNGCLHQSRRLAHKGDSDWIKEVFGAWSDMNLSQPRGSGDYDWYRTINFAASTFALLKEEVDFSPQIRAWLKNSLSSTQLKFFGKNNTYYPRAIVENPDVFVNDCSTTRFMYTQAYLIGGLALNDQELFDEGIDSLQYILAGFDEENVYKCWGMRGIRVTSYHNQVPSYFSAFHLILETVGYDFFEHKMPNGNTVHEAAKTTFQYAWEDDIGPLLKYAHVNLGVAGVNNWEDLKRPLLKRNPNYQTNPPATALRSSIVYVERYQPELKKLFGYELFYSGPGVKGTKFPDGYPKKNYFSYAAFHGDQPLDLNAVYRAKNYDTTIRDLNFTNGYLDPPFHPEITNYTLNYEAGSSPMDLTLRLQDPNSTSTTNDETGSSSENVLSIGVRSKDSGERIYKFAKNGIALLKDRYECHFLISRLLNGVDADAELAEGRVRIVKGRPIFRAGRWWSGNDEVPPDFLNQNSELLIAENGHIYGTSKVFTMIGTAENRAFSFGRNFKADEPYVPEGENFGIGYVETEAIAMNLSIRLCTLIPDVVVEKPQPSEQPSEEKFAFKPVSVDFTPLSIEFYHLFENDEFLNFKGEIKDSEGQQFGKGKLNIGLMFDFRNLKKKQKNIVRDYNISVDVDGLVGVTNIEDIRSCEKAFWEDDGQIKQVFIRMKRLKENKCVFEKLPEDTVAILQRLATNMAEILERATFKDQSWNERVTTLSSRFH